MAKNIRNTKAKKGGRPTDYQAKYNKQAYKLCLLGYTDKELAEFFEVEESTINNWKKVYPKFLESIKKGKDHADTKVVESLYKRACGYDSKDVTFEKIDNKENLEITNDSVITTEAYKKKITTKEVAPDPTSIIFWLKNRQPKKWRDKIDLEHSGEQTIINIVRPE